MSLRWGARRARRHGDGLPGLIISVVGFDNDGTGLMMTIFALQDSFGTACNITGDGALTLMLTGYAKKHNIQEAPGNPLA